jgi:uncharacterized protein (TIGR03382 family)
MNMKRLLTVSAGLALLLAGSAFGVVLWDNGPLVTHPGGGAGGADASVVDTVAGMTLYGFGHQWQLGYSMADDFEVGAGGWTIDSMLFYAYQTNSGNNSTITGVYAQIYDGPPDAGGTVVWGNLTTNLLANTSWSNIYRVLDTAMTSTARPVMENEATIGTFLAEGTYWVEWSTNGTLSSGPWAPPVTIIGQPATGNGLQNLAGVWGPALDGTYQQGLPFIINGVPTPGALPLLLLGLGWTRRRR